MKRSTARLNVREESTSMLRAAREVFGPHADLFGELLAEIDLELAMRDLPVIAEERGAHLVVAPREVA